MENVAKRICSSHPTLQQNSMQLFLECIALWSEKHKTGVGKDQRNQVTCEVSHAIVDAFEFDENNPEQPVGFIDGRPALPFI
jgi:hypothetical protein